MVLPALNPWPPLPSCTLPLVGCQDPTSLAFPLSRLFLLSFVGLILRALPHLPPSPCTRLTNSSSGFISSSVFSLSTADCLLTSPLGDLRGISDVIMSKPKLDALFLFLAPNLLLPYSFPFHKWQHFIFTPLSRPQTYLIPSDSCFLHPTSSLSADSAFEMYLKSDYFYHLLC